MSRKNIHVATVRMSMDMSECKTLAELREYLADVEAEHGASGYIDADWVSDDRDSGYDFRYIVTRPETDEEMASREARDAADTTERRMHQIAAAHQEFLRLKAIFEPPKNGEAA